MRTIIYDQVVEVARELWLETHFQLREDVRLALEGASESEEQPARNYISLLLENAEVAERERLPLSSDSGMPIFFVEMGDELQLDEGTLEGALTEGMKRAFSEFPIRTPWLRDPLSAEQSTREIIPPVVHVELVAGEELKITCMRFGGESEHASRVAFLSPSYTIDDIRNFVVNSIQEARDFINPPCFVGVGIGSSFGRVGLLAKKAILRPIGKPHALLECARLEQELLHEINELGIGAGGLGGSATALAVHVDTAPAFSGAVPIAVHVQGYDTRTSEHIL